MSFYLFNDVFIDFDYKQNVVEGDCIIISKEFGNYKYDNGIDSMNLNIPKDLLHSRYLVSSSSVTGFNYVLNEKDTLLSIIKKVKINKPLTIFLDRENYVYLLSSYFKSLCPSMKGEVLYDLYSHLMICFHTLGVLNRPEYILPKLKFLELFEKSDIVSFDSSLINSSHLFIKFATIYSGNYTLSQFEELKSILIKTAENFYVRMFKKFYRKIVENYHTSEDSEIVKLKNNKIYWKIMEGREIGSSEDVTHELIKYFCENPNLITEECKDFIEVQVVGENQSFKKLLNMRQELYKRINKNYKGIIRADPVHYFFMDRSPTKFNPVEFIKYCSNFHFNSDIFASDTFKGSIHFVASFMFNLIRKENSNIKCFSLNKLD